MKFVVTASHVKQENRKTFYFIVLFALMLLGCVVKLSSAQTVANMVFPALGILVFASSILPMYRRIKAGAAAYPILNLDESSSTVEVSHQDIAVKVDLQAIENLRLQYKSDQIKSIVLKTSSGQILRFEGYENLDVLGNALERITPQEHITAAKHYHR